MLSDVAFVRTPQSTCRATSNPKADMAIVPSTDNAGRLIRRWSSQPTNPLGVRQPAGPLYSSSTPGRHYFRGDTVGLQQRSLLLVLLRVVVVVNIKVRVTNGMPRGPSRRPLYGNLLWLILVSKVRLESVVMHDHRLRVGRPTNLERDVIQIS